MNILFSICVFVAFAYAHVSSTAEQSSSYRPVRRNYDGVVINTNDDHDNVQTSSGSYPLTRDTSTYEASRTGTASSTAQHVIRNVKPGTSAILDVQTSSGIYPLTRDTSAYVIRNGRARTSVIRDDQTQEDSSRKSTLPSSGIVYYGSTHIGSNVQIEVE